MDRSQKTLKRGELGVTETEEPTGDDPGKPQEGFASQDDPESGKGSGKAMNADAKMLDESKPASQKPSSGKLEENKTDYVEEDDPGERRESIEEEDTIKDLD